MKMAEPVKNALVAALIGVFMMMPGVSGATVPSVMSQKPAMIRQTMDIASSSRNAMQIPMTAKTMPMYVRSTERS